VLVDHPTVLHAKRASITVRYSQPVGAAKTNVSDGVVEFPSAHFRPCMEARPVMTKIRKSWCALIVLLALAAVGCNKTRRPPFRASTESAAAESPVDASPSIRRSQDGRRLPSLDWYKTFGHGEAEPWSLQFAADESNRELMKICQAIRGSGADRSCRRDQDCTPAIACIGVNAKDLRGRQQMEAKWRATGCPAPPRCLSYEPYCRAGICY
jgi:hypothetical protein